MGSLILINQPVLKKYKSGWLVEFYTLDNKQHKKQRHRISLKNIDIRDRYTYARRLIAEITQRFKNADDLSDTTVIEAENISLVSQAAAFFLAVKKKELKSASVATYTKKIDLLFEFLSFKKFLMLHFPNLTKLRWQSF